MRIVMITAMWCSACLIVAPKVRELTKNIDLLELDYDFDDYEYEIGKILPVLIKEVDGKEVSRLIGEKTKEEIEAFIGV